MFSKILIANRGEIACRIIRTAKRMGVKTVAVYSDADANGLHVELADEAVLIGPALAAASYLHQENIICAALDTGAQAIHPGYGFLSENPDFAEAVAAAGLTFIGPSAKAIRAMGLKDAAKALMQKAGVPVVPGYHGEAQDMVVLAGKAIEIGYPVLIKARAGGGGKGMRRVDQAGDFRNALASARHEAKAAFGDDRVMVEKYIERPRHIEVQIFGDSHGNLVHLYERDCSLQRRHQKLIEEAPAPGMSDEMRNAMVSAALMAAKAVNYSGAGTVEFIVDASQGLRPDGFWFMEMNTRLQVEHPVTEMVTGIDLVEWQLLVATGETLPLAQEQISLNGHAIEARLNAEDVARGFLPATGTLHHLEFPEKARIDTGVRQGDVISPHYDPMIAKIIAHGKNRSEALSRLHAALQYTRVAGTVTNRAFLAALTQDEAFASGEFDTGLIDRNLENLALEPGPSSQIIAVAAYLAVFCTEQTPEDAFFSLGTFALWGTREHFVDLAYGKESLYIKLETKPNGAFTASWNDISFEFTVKSSLQHECSIISSGKEYSVDFARYPDHLAIFDAGDSFEFTMIDPLQRTASIGDISDQIIAPMPGLVGRIFVKTGQRISKGQPIVVLEAMKMEHTLSAQRDGAIAHISVNQGDQVTDRALLVTLKPIEEPHK